MDRKGLTELIGKVQGCGRRAINETETVVVQNEQIADYLIANGIGDITVEKARADSAEGALETVQGIALNIIHENAYDTDILLKRAIKAGVKVDDLLCCPHTNSKKQAYEKQLQQAEKEGE